MIKFPFILNNVFHPYIWKHWSYYKKDNVETYHDSSVEGKKEDDPVPRGLEGAVVQEDVGRGAGSLLAVLRQDVRAQAHQLNNKSINIDV